MGANVSNGRRERLNRHLEIEKTLREDKKKFNDTFKLLLIGTGGSGKSTVMKQMRILYANGFTDGEIEGQKIQIFHNIFESIQAMIRAMKDLSINFDQPTSEMLAGVVIKAAENWVHGGTISAGEWSCIKDLWVDKGVQKCFRRSNEYQLGDSTKYFLDDIDRISAPAYIPTKDDILRLRVNTVGVVELTYPFRDRTLTVIDVGGQRAQRRKWIHCFEGVNSLIYVASLSEYNETLLEDNKTNRMEEALKLFSTICNCQWFQKTPVLLFLNKKDIFAEKIKRFPLKDTFPNYRGSQEYEETIKFIKTAYEKRKQTNTDDLYVHETCATNTQNVQFVIDASFAIIMAKSLKDAVVKALLFSLGILEALLAFSIIGCGIACIILGSRLYPLGHAIWTGAFFLIAAVLAILASLTGRRGLYAAHNLIAILSCIFVLPCLIGLWIIEMISDSWYNFWNDPNWCQGGCFASDGSYVRINYATLWTRVHAIERVLQCKGSTWTTNCHPHIEAQLCEIVGITLAAVLFLLFLTSIMLSCVYTRYIASDFVSPSEKVLDRPQSPKSTLAYFTNQNLYTSWNLPQYNTLHYLTDKPVPVYATIRPKTKHPTERISENYRIREFEKYKEI